MEALAGFTGARPVDKDSVSFSQQGAKNHSCRRTSNIQMTFVGLL
jgi:hypothetical protein